MSPQQYQRKYPELTYSQIYSRNSTSKKRKDMAQRICSRCGSKETRTQKQAASRIRIMDGQPYAPYPCWYKDKHGGFLCYYCWMPVYQRKYRLNNRKKRKFRNENNRKLIAKQQ
jgi:hypothetical protein